MAISTPTRITSRFQTADSPTLVLPESGTIDLVAGRLYLLFYTLTPGDFTSPITGLSGPLFPIADFISGASQRGIIGWWYIPAADETAITITLTRGSDYTNSAGALIEIAAGFNPTMPIASLAVSNQGTVGLSVTLSLPSPPAASSLGVVAFGRTAKSLGANPRAGWTELSDDGGIDGGADSGGLQTQYLNPGEQDASASVDATPNPEWFGIHLEIKAAEEPTPMFGLAASGTMR